MHSVNPRLLSITTVTVHCGPRYGELESNSLNILWNCQQPSGQNDYISILDLIENSDALIRSRYLEHLTSFISIPVLGKPLYEHFELKGFNYFPSSLLMEKSNIWKSPSILEALKILALEQLVLNSSINKIVLKKADHNTYVLIKKFCTQKNITLSIDLNLRQLAYKFTVVSQMLLRSKIIINAFFFFVLFLWRQVPFVIFKPARQSVGKTDILLISYLNALIPSKDRTFSSVTWGPLLDKIKISGKSIFYLYIPVNKTRFKSIFSAAKYIAALNSSLPESQSHICITSYLSPRIVFLAALEYFKLSRITVEIIPSIRCSSMFNDFFLLELFRSFLGPSAVHNYFYKYLFEEFFSHDTSYSLSSYPLEFQGWESLFLQVSNGLGMTSVGYPHACIRYWDLRYLFSKKLISIYDDYYSLPLFIASTSSLINHKLIDSGFNKNRIVLLESLRYSWISPGLASTSRVSTKSQKYEPSILILLDYKVKSSLLLLDCAYSLRDSFKNSSITLREHPSCPINCHFHDSSFEISSQGFLEDLSQCDLVVSSCSTTAALEAYICSKHVLILLENDSLHYGPLKSIDYPYTARNIPHVIELVKDFCSSRNSLTYQNEDLKHIYTSDLCLWGSLIDSFTS